LTKTKYCPHFTFDDGVDDGVEQLTQYNGRTNRYSAYFINDRKSFCSG